MFRQAIAVVVLSAFAVLLDIGPLFWHVKNRNWPVCSLIIWLLLLNFFNFINAGLWGTDDIEHWFMGYGLCDVEIKIRLGSYTGTTGAIACIMRQLAAIMDTKRMTLLPTKAQRMRDLAFIMTMCWGFPVLMMVVHYVVQPYRYGIEGITGCAPLLDPSWPAEILIRPWSLVFCLIDCYYAALVVIRMLRYRLEMASVLVHSNITRSRYLRRFTMTLLLLLLFIPLQIYLYVKTHIIGWPVPYSWMRVHANWNIIPVRQTGGYADITVWVYSLCALIVFLCTGLGEDAKAMYRGWMEEAGITKLLQVCQSFLRNLLNLKPCMIPQRTTKHGSLTETETDSALLSARKTALARSSLMFDETIMCTPMSDSFAFTDMKTGISAVEPV